jgi:hypothetical protein
MKKCKRCELEKDETEFVKRKAEKDGLHRYCKVCSYDIGKKYYHNTGKISRELYYKEYRTNNKEKIKIGMRLAMKKHRAKNNNYRLRDNIQTLLRYHIKNKTQSVIKYIGCTLQEYNDHISAQFKPEMNWENYGIYWEIDHIIPISSFDLSIPEEANKAFHFSNTQPLTITENRKKSNKRSNAS